MANCSSIINRALRKIGRLGAGRDARPADAQDALDVLRGMYLSWISSGAFGRLSDVIVSSDFTAGENMRVVRPYGVTATITLPETVPMYADPLPYNREREYYTNYESVDGNNRPPRDGAVVVIADQATGTTLTWIYDGSVKVWREIDTMTLTDLAPMSAGDPDGLAACLAVECADQFAGEPSQLTVRAAVRFTTELTSRFSMPRQVTQGVYV